MSAKQVSVHAKWIIGKVIGTKMHKTAKVRVTRLVMDPYLLKRHKLVPEVVTPLLSYRHILLSNGKCHLKVYYNKRKTYFAHDALQQCTMGDIVLLKALSVPRSKHVKHELSEIVHKVGRVVDPLTGKRVEGTEFSEPLTDLPLSLGKDTTLSEKLQELNISAAASSEADSQPAQTPTL